MNRDFVNRMLVWYNAGKRDLPWRRTRDPYRIWLSEIMLQQTRVETVRAYYERFLGALPDAAALAGADEETVLKLWEGLGYYSRARNLHRAARVIAGTYGGTFPGSYEEIRKLPGIGSYTAGAVASIAFGIPEPAVDGNVLRVFSRLLASRENVLDAAARRRTEDRIRTILRSELPPPEEYEGNAAGDFNQSLIELGALICTPGAHPDCEGCPVSVMCRAYSEHLTGELPVRVKKNTRRTEDLTVLLVHNGKGYAIARRPDRGLLAGLYELPHLEGHQDARQVKRALTLRHLTVHSLTRLPDASHTFSHVEWHMTGYLAEVSGPGTGEDGWQFVRPEEIRAEKPVPSAFSAYTKFMKGSR